MVEEARKRAGLAVWGRGGGSGSRRVSEMAVIGEEVLGVLSGRLR